MELAGPVLAWSASEVTAAPDGEPRRQAAVLGRAGFAVAEPTVKAVGSGYRPVFALASYRLDAGSLLQAPVTHYPHSPSGVGGSISWEDGPAAESLWQRRQLRGLDADTASVIGSMPPRAQELLVVPIAAHDEPVLRAHRFWQGSSPAFLEVVMVVLASPGRVTAVAGRRTIPVGHDAATAHWSLTAWHGDVFARRGL